MTTPRPGRPVRGSTTGRPIMALLDLLGRRAALRVLWELRAGCLTFRALVDAADTNPSVLNARLAELREAGVVDHAADGYGLTAAGADLLARLAPLHAWAEQWAKRGRSATEPTSAGLEHGGTPSRPASRRDRAIVRRRPRR